MRKAQPAEKKDPVPGNLAIWDDAMVTNRAFHKAYNGANGFQGTSINPMWLIQRATEVFGPMGLGWGVDVESEEIIDGKPLHLSAHAVVYSKIHKIKARLWYKWKGEIGAVYQYGHTVILDAASNGYIQNEDYAKSSLTDATSKCLSLLGFGADVYLQLWADPEYVEKAVAKFAGKAKDASAAKDVEETVSVVAEPPSIEPCVPAPNAGIDESTFPADLVKSLKRVRDINPALADAKSRLESARSFLSRWSGIQAAAYSQALSAKEEELKKFNEAQLASA